MLKISKQGIERVEVVNGEVVSTTITVERQKRDESFNAGYQMGYAAGLQAALDAAKEGRD
jgi:hypothetical protein